MLQYSLKDKIISILPEPFFSIGILLFMPNLWKLLDTMEMTKNDNDTLLTFQGVGHLVVNENGIRQIGE